MVDQRGGDPTIFGKKFARMIYSVCLFISFHSLFAWKTNVSIIASLHV